MSASTLICASCGTAVRADRLFCPSCGALVVAAEPDVASHLAPDHVAGTTPDEAALPLEAAPENPPPAAVAAAAVDEAAQPTPPSAPPPAPRPGEAPLFADLPFDAPDDLPGWLVAIGAGIATVAYFLPWAPQVFGASGFGTYLDEWGFAALSHLPGFLFAGLVTGLAIIPNRLAGWVRNGLLPLVLGGYLLGLVWPYAFGGFGGRIGSMAEVAGAILLLVGGTLAISPRHRDHADGPR